MPSKWTLKPPLDADSQECFGDILAMTFHMNAEEKRTYVDRVGAENLRIVSKGSHVIGGLALIPTGQWFGGKVVSCTGVTSVCIQPHERSHGAGRHLLMGTLREMHDNGTALSALYPVTQPGYRRMGYEHAGALWDMHLTLDRIRIKDHDLDVRELSPADEAGVTDLYRRRAAQNNGQLERNDFLWKEVRKSDRGVTHGYAVVEDGRIEAAIYYLHQKSDDAFYALHATDLIVGSANAARRMLAFLADHRSMADVVRWPGSPNDMMLTLLREQCYRAKLKQHWMLRIINVQNALTQRGYPPRVDAHITLDIRDDILPANNRQLTLHVADGKGTVDETTTSARATAAIDIRGFASLYTGHLSPAQLVLHGYLDADDVAITTLAAIFASPAPWMADLF